MPGFGILVDGTNLQVPEALGELLSTLRITDASKVYSAINFNKSAVCQALNLSVNAYPQALTELIRILPTARRPAQGRRPFGCIR